MIIGHLNSSLRNIISTESQREIINQHAPNNTNSTHKDPKSYKLRHNFGLKNNLYCGNGKKDEIRNNFLSEISIFKTAEKLRTVAVSLHNHLKFNHELKDLRGNANA